MSRYIDADALIQWIKDVWDWESVDGITSSTVLKQTITDIENHPTADVVEVKHGRWIKDRLCSTSGGTYGVRRCSVCEYYYQDVGYGWNYCPNCGAKMDEREEEDEQIH